MSVGTHSSSPAGPPPAGQPPAQPSLAGRRRVAFLRALAVAAAVIVVDRITKHLVVKGIADGDVHKFLPGIQLVHVRNSGVAFGFFSGGGALVLILTLAALTALVVYFVRASARGRCCGCPPACSSAARWAT